jgi:hypothetical protein
MVSVTGIMAFYQTKVPFHRKGKFLGDRDFFGECCAAAKKRGRDWERMSEAEREAFIDDVLHEDGSR